MTTLRDPAMGDQQTSEYDVYLIGTYHEFQAPDGTRSENDITDFKDLLRRSCRQFGICAMAEEMNMEALGQRSLNISTCKQIAEELRIAHRYCDPEFNQRTALGIIEEADIHIQQFREGFDDTEKARRIRCEYAKRERHWLTNLLTLRIFPILYVCGANHVESFESLLTARGLRCLTLNERWPPQANQK